MLALLLYLRTRNYRVGQGEICKILALFEGPNRLQKHDGDELSWETCAAYIAPILCTSRDEQTELAREIEHYLTLHRRHLGATNHDSVPESDKEGTKESAAAAPVTRIRRGFRRQLLAGTVLLSLALIGLYKETHRQITPVPQPSSFASSQPRQPISPVQPTQSPRPRQSTGPSHDSYKTVNDELIKSPYLPVAKRRMLTYAALPWLLGEYAACFLVWGVFGVAFFYNRSLPVIASESFRYTNMLDYLRKNSGKRHALSLSSRIRRGFAYTRISDSHKLDISRTIRASVRTAGVPTFVYSSLNAETRHGILIQRLSIHDHLTALGESLAAALHEQRIAHKAFYFYQDLDLLRDERDQTVRLRELLKSQMFDTLVVVSEANALVGDFAFRPSQIVLEAVASGVRMELYTPTPPGEWGPREALLQSHGVSIRWLASADAGEALDKTSVVRTFAHLSVAPLTPEFTARSLDERRARGLPIPSFSALARFACMRDGTLGTDARLEGTAILEKTHDDEAAYSTIRSWVETSAPRVGRRGSKVDKLIERSVTRDVTHFFNDGVFLRWLRRRGGTARKYLRSEPRRDVFRSGALVALAVTGVISIVVPVAAVVTMHRDVVQQALRPARENRPIRTIATTGDDIRSIAMTPDGNKIIASTGGKKSDVTFRIWDMHSGLLLHTISLHNTAAQNFYISDDGGELVGPTLDGYKIWDIQSGLFVSELQKIRTNDHSFKSYIANPQWLTLNGKKMIDATAFGGAASFFPPKRFTMSPLSGATRATYISKGKDYTLELSDFLKKEMTVTFYTVGAHKKLFSLTGDSSIFGLDSVYSGNTSRVAISNGLKSANIIDVLSGVKIQTLPINLKNIDSFRMGDSGKFAALSLSDSQKVEVWNINLGRKLYTLKPGFLNFKNSYYYDFNFLQDENLLAIEAPDSIYLRNLENGLPLWEIPSLQRLSYFSPDGTIVVTADDHRLRIWQADSSTFSCAYFLWILPVTITASAFVGILLFPRISRRLKTQTLFTFFTLVALSLAVLMYAGFRSANFIPMTLSPQDIIEKLRTHKPAIFWPNHPELMQYAAAYSQAVSGTSDIDECMLAAFTSRESGGQNILQIGLEPGPGTGVGLLQIIDKVDWKNTSNPIYPGYGPLLDPTINLTVGAHEYIQPALSMLQKFTLPTSPYAESLRYIAAFDSFNMGPDHIESTLSSGIDPTLYTTGHDYGTTVFHDWLDCNASSLRVDIDWSQFDDKALSDLIRSLKSSHPRKP